ncbi:MAG: carboxypeptidase-like regulatory domain-containing protein, partial [Rhodothermales bacterium]
MLRRWGTLVLILFAAPALALAQNTGKLSGQVLDASSGEPLPGAAVVIEGTQLGAATDVDGNYFIIGVPVGEYDIRATFVGFSPQTVAGVEINAGYTREINLELSPGIELEGVVVEYERPLIQNDAIGVPNVTTAEDIANLPVRGVANVAALQGGVVKEEGSDNLYIRGGREQGVSYYVDGVKVLGDNVSVTSLAVQEQEMLIGSIPARYGDATSGVISITTKTGSPDFFGTIEGISSEVLDPYGYNQLSGTLGGPLFSENVSFFFSGEYSNLGDSSPRAISFPQLSESDLEFLQNNPQAVAIINDETEEVSYIPFPGNLANTAAGDTTFPAQVLEMLTGSLPDGFSFVSPDHPEPVEAPTTYLGDRFTQEAAKPNDGEKSLILNGNIQVSPIQSVRLRGGGSFETSDGREFSYIRSLYAPNRLRKQDRDTWRTFLSFTQYLSNSTFYQIQADYSDYKGFNYHPDFSNNVEDILSYGDIDNPANATARRYKQYDTDAEAYVNVYGDGSLPTVRQIQSNCTAPGGETFGGYTKWHYTRFGLRASAQTQLGLHQLEFGGEFEQQTRRYFNISDPYGLARFEQDGSVEGDSSFAVSQYSDLAFNVMDDEVFYYGYNYLGNAEVDDQNIDDFTGKRNFNVAPYQP